MYLPRQLEGRIHPFRSLAKGVVLMYVTYDDLFTFVLMIVAIITLVKSFYDKRKK
nr:MAG TPA: holin [Caudoviricetes sp.]